MSLSAALDRLRNDTSLRGAAFSTAWRTEVDAWLGDLFERATSGTSDRLALVAVGGYGRGDLAPGSDLDLLLLHTAKTPPAEVAQALWYPIWDEGLKLGHSVRTVAEAVDLAAGDLDTATALLSARHLAGDPTLTEELATAARSQWQRKAKRSLAALAEGVAQRQAQFGELAYLLEPDLKEGRGGLRDIHALRWAQAARPVLETGDAEALAAAEETLFDARVELHRSTGRATDQLALQDQDAVARALGTDADTLMADLAHAGRTVAWIADEAWDRVAASLSTGSSLLGWRSQKRAPGIAVKGGQVVLEASVDPANRPGIELDVAVVAAQKRSHISRATLARLVARAPHPPAVWPEDLRAKVLRLLACGHDAIVVIEALDHVGLWERYLPEWTVVRHRPQRNAYHRFTVDRHLLEATANAASFTDRVERPDLLLFGALLHDIGKGRPGDHTEVGMELVAEIGPRMGYGPEDTAVLVDLVRHHLLLPDAATRRDLSDETTITTVAEAVGDPLRLALLAALTEADSLATGPAAWGSWKAGLVRDLERRVAFHLDGGNLDALVVSEFPTAEHLALLDAGRLRIEGAGEELTVVAPDRPGLFTRVAGVLALNGLEVLSADAASVDGMAIEVFRVTSRFGSMIAWDRVEAQLQAALANRLALDARIAERVKTYAPKASRPDLPPPAVRFDDAASTSATVVEVHARDRIGLLYRVSRAFAEFELDVRTAKIQTLGELVVDTFYLTTRDGDLVSDPDLRSELQRSLLHLIG